MPRLLFVCHGNVARSAAAHVICRDLLPPDGAWSVRSAGVGALVGRPVADDVAAALRALGHDPSGHRAQQVSPRVTADQDLIVCMANAQRQWLIEEDPTLARRTVVFGHLERIAREAPRRVDGLAHVLLQHGPAVPADDVADPYGRGPEAARIAVQRIERGLAVIGPVLGLWPRH